MALLRYTLRDTTEKVEVKADWVEELYYGPIFVKQGYAEVPDHDEFSILVLCNRGFELVKDAPKAEDAEVEPEDVDDTEQDEPEAEDTDDEPADEEEQDDEAIPTEKELRKMTRAQLNHDAGLYGVTEDAESFENKDDLITAILAAQADGSND